MKRKWKIALGVVGIVILIAVIVVIRLTSSPSFEPYASLTLPVSENPEGDIRARFFGTTTILVSDGETFVMVDGFFSRPSLTSLIMSKIAPDESRIDKAL